MYVYFECQNIAFRMFQVQYLSFSLYKKVEMFKERCKRYLIGCTYAKIVVFVPLDDYYILPLEFRKLHISFIV